VASIPKVVQEAVGHSTIAVTLDLYSHVVPSLQRETAKEMGGTIRLIQSQMPRSML
jgi:integrase